MGAIVMKKDTSEIFGETIADSSNTVLSSDSTKLTTERRDLTELQKQAIIADRVAGLTVRAIAKKYGKSSVTIWRICKPLKELAGSALSESWRTEAQKLAQSAVNAGLSSKKDPYKQGSLGIATLKGLGLLETDQVSLNVQSLVTNVPPALASMLSTDTSALDWPGKNQGDVDLDADTDAGAVEVDTDTDASD
jgi:transposase